MLGDSGHAGLMRAQGTDRPAIAYAHLQQLLSIALLLQGSGEGHGQGLQQQRQQQSLVSLPSQGSQQPAAHQQSQAGSGYAAEGAVPMTWDPRVWGGLPGDLAPGVGQQQQQQQQAQAQAASYHHQPGGALPGLHLLQDPMLQAQLHQQTSGMLHQPQAQRVPAAEQVQGGGAGLRLTPQQLLDLLQASRHHNHHHQQQQQQAAPPEVPGDAQLQQLLQSLVRSQQPAHLQEQGQYFQHGGQSSFMAPQASLCSRAEAWQCSLSGHSGLKGACRGSLRHAAGLLLSAAGRGIPGNREEAGAVAKPQGGRCLSGRRCKAGDARGAQPSGQAEACATQHLSCTFGRCRFTDTRGNVTCCATSSWQCICATCGTFPLQRRAQALQKRNETAGLV